jgi:hypothetical protein
MPSRSYYQRQAEILRAIAAAAPDQVERDRQLRRANEYVVLAMSLPDDGYVPPIASPVTDRPQPTGQQQQQIQPDKGEPEKKE